MTADAAPYGGHDAPHRTDDGALDVAQAMLRSRLVVLSAPGGTVNTGLVYGDQRHGSVTGDGPAEPMRQGPVRARELAVVREQFAPPPGFAPLPEPPDGPALLALVGAPGTGRRTAALRLLAGDRADPAIVQVDGSVDFARWRPGPQGAHGYLVREPGDPHTLRPWELADLEEALTEARARMVLVLSDRPGLVRFLTQDLGVQVRHHEPPRPEDVFAAHLRRWCPDGHERTRRLRALGTRFRAEALPQGLPPGYAAQVAEAVARAAPGTGRAALLGRLAAAEAPELLARAAATPEVLAMLLAVCVYGGLDGVTVAERAADLLAAGLAEECGDASPGGAGGPRAREPWHRHTAPQGRDTVRRPPLSEVLPRIGARGGEAEPVTFLWPAVGEAVRDVVCREHSGLLPLLHRWLGGAGPTEVEAERAGRAVAGLAVGTRGRTLPLVRRLTLAEGGPGADVAGWALGVAAGEPVVADSVRELLAECAAASGAAPRTALAYACRPERGGGIPVGTALPLLHRAVAGRGNGDAEVAVAPAVRETVRRHFAAAGARDRACLVRHLAEWAAAEDVPALLAALCVPALLSGAHAWFGAEVAAGRRTAARLVALVRHALNESVAYPAMRDALLVWCHWAQERPERLAQAEELFNRLVDGRQPGVLRLLLSVERGGVAMPVPDLARRSLAEWRRRYPSRETA
ncbi:hypothetical protein [Streptomyces sp. NPDC002067]